jgi:hypothetical protein
MESSTNHKKPFINYFSSARIEIFITIALILITIIIGSFNEGEYSNWFLLTSVIIEVLVGLSLILTKSLIIEINNNKSEVSNEIIVNRNHIDDFYKYFQNQYKISKHLDELSEHESLLDHINTILSNLVNLNRNEKRLMLSVMVDRLENDAKVFAQIGGQHTYIKELEKVKSPIQKIFESFIDNLKKGDEYITISNLDFWSYKTLSHMMQFADSNVTAAERGVSIKRVIVIDKKIQDLEMDQLIFLLKYHSATFNIPNFETKVCVLEGWKSIEDYRTLDKIGTLGICKKGNSDEAILLQIDFRLNDIGDRIFDKLKVIVDLKDVANQQVRFRRWFERENAQELGKIINKIEETISKRESMEEGITEVNLDLMAEEENNTDHNRVDGPPTKS